jgi:hypothetical protein
MKQPAAADVRGLQVKKDSGHSFFTGNSELAITDECRLFAVFRADLTES